MLKEISEMTNSTLVAGFWDTISFLPFLYWWQVPCILLLVAIIIFWVMYRRKQM